MRSQSLARTSTSSHRCRIRSWCYCSIIYLLFQLRRKSRLVCRFRVQKSNFFASHFARESHANNTPSAVGRSNALCTAGICFFWSRLPAFSLPVFRDPASEPRLDSRPAYGKKSAQSSGCKSSLLLFVIHLVSDFALYHVEPSRFPNSIFRFPS
ncbi:hypothetical protein PMIN06_001474 [Paraphaeosphaeria minitans]